MSKRLLTLSTLLVTAAAVQHLPARPAVAQTSPATRPATVLPATLDAYEQADLYPRASGYITEVKVDIGDAVKFKDPLAIISQPELDKELAEAIALHAARGKQLEAADAAVEQSKAALEVANREVARYRADAELQEVTYRRQEELYAGKATTDQQRDEAKNRYEVAKAGADIAVAKAAAAAADLKGVQAARAVAEAQVDVTAAQVEKVKALQAYLQIVAPFDGVVTRRTVHRGDLALSSSAKGTPLFTVQRIDRIRVRCDVPEALASQIDKGTPATIRIVALGQTIEAPVTRAARSLHPETRSMRVEIELDNADRRLIPGMYAQVTLTPTAPATQPSR
jgi:multidrug resistance efflux pump